MHDLILGGVIGLLGSCVSRNPLYDPSANSAAVDSGAGGTPGSGGQGDRGGSGGTSLAGGNGGAGGTSLGGQGGGGLVVDAATVDTEPTTDTGPPVDARDAVAPMPDSAVSVDGTAPPDAPASCTHSSACTGGAVCSGGVCLPAHEVLVVDDFEDGNLAPNAMGGWITTHNQNASIVAGEARFAWNGANVYQGFVETFVSNFCAYDLRPYRKLRFRLRTTATTPQPVRVFLALTYGTCNPDSVPNLRTITVSTAMQTFEFDLQAIDRQRALFLEIGPNTNDAVYFLDDVHLLK